MCVRVSYVLVHCVFRQLLLFGELACVKDCNRNHLYRTRLLHANDFELLFFWSPDDKCAKILSLPRSSSGKHTHTHKTHIKWIEKCRLHNNTAIPIINIPTNSLTCHMLLFTNGSMTTLCACVCVCVPAEEQKNVRAYKRLPTQNGKIIKIDW